MKIWKKIIILTALALSQSKQASSDDYNFGDFRTTYVAEAFHFYKDQPSISQLATYIRSYHKHFDWYSQMSKQERLDKSKALATKIELVTKCLKLDFKMFAAIIAIESDYHNKAMNKITHASGLTQILRTSIREVNDQLGIPAQPSALGDLEPKYERARKTTTIYFNKQINSCISNSTNKYKYTALWDRDELKDFELYSEQWFDNALKVIRNDEMLSLIYGAVLLKSKLSILKTIIDGDPKESLMIKTLRSYGEDNDLYIERYKSAVKEIDQLIK